MKKQYNSKHLYSLCEFILSGIEHGTLTNYNIDNILSSWENSNKTSDDIEVWIDDWINLWPDGIRNKGGVLIKNKRNVVLKKMLDFCKNNNYSKDIIFKATERYLRSKERDMFQYARASMYFISKIEKGTGKTSQLADECERLKEIENEHNTGRREFNEIEEPQERGFFV